MSCSYHRAELELTGTCLHVKKYSPPFHRRVFGTVNVTWFARVNIQVASGEIYRLYDFEETTKPETRTKGTLPRPGEECTVIYSPVSARNQRRGCIREVIS